MATGEPFKHGICSSGRGWMRGDLFRTLWISTEELSSRTRRGRQPCGLTCSSGEFRLHLSPLVAYTLIVRYNNMPCILNIRGANLDLTKALATVTFTPYASHRKGDPLKRRPTRHYEDSGFQVYASEACESDLPRQCKEAEAFLMRHFDELRLIEGATESQLDFGFDCRIGTGERGKAIAIQCDYIPVGLVKLCGALSIGIALTQFPPREEDSQSEQCVDGNPS